MKKIKNFIWNPGFQAVAAVGAIGVAGFFALNSRDGFYPVEYVRDAAEIHDSRADCESGECADDDFIQPVAHIRTPEPVKAIYMTACVAGTPSWRERLAQMVEDSELNSMVIDVKDYTGTIAFDTEDKSLVGLKGGGCRVRDMKEFVQNLHERGIYAIARITVFQDPLMSESRPDLAIKKASDKSVVWKDRKGLSFIDPGARDHWDYTVKIAEESYAIGFDELNFDYIRFPSDGNMKDIYFPFSEERVSSDADYGKAKVLRDFLSHLDEKLNEEAPDAILSADLFGMAATNYDDLNIGQVLEYAEPYFDYLSPMVYPSHYPKGFNGYTNVNTHPYDIVKFSMDKAVERLIAASSTPSKMRPWLQDFDYPVAYTPDMVRAQIQATYDAGLTSWMMWDAGNKYTPEVYTQE